MLKIGMIGGTPGNGHPWSWSSIINGRAVGKSHYEIIDRYMEENRYNNDGLEGAQVTRIYMPDTEEAHKIKRWAGIEKVSESILDLSREVDAIIFAREDFHMFRWLLQSGKPIYVDKPIATSVAVLNKILNEQVYSGQIFTCSALRYAEAFQPKPEYLAGAYAIEGRVPGSWESYVIHVLEPILVMLEHHQGTGDIELSFDCGNPINPFQIEISKEIDGLGRGIVLQTTDYYPAFKAALTDFIAIARKEKPNIITETFLTKLVSIIEKGVPQ